MGLTGVLIYLAGASSVWLVVTGPARGWKWGRLLPARMTLVLVRAELDRSIRRYEEVERALAILSPVEANEVGEHSCNQPEPTAEEVVPRLKRLLGRLRSRSAQ